MTTGARDNSSPGFLFLTLVLALILVTTVTALAGQPAITDTPEPVDRDLIVTGGPMNAAKSLQDTVVVYGGPGTLEGKFQTSNRIPDRQGWIGVDRTYMPEIYWQTDTFHAANLDPATPGNHAWWCGTVLDTCDATDPPEGYGNDWFQSLSWFHAVADSGVAATVRLTASLNIDSEPGYDYLYLQYRTETGYQTVWSQDGQYDNVLVDESFVVAPGDHQGDNADEIHLRWLFESDGGWSDMDCLWPTDTGAAQVDLITVTFDQGTGPVQMGPTETAEPGDPSSWTAESLLGVGDFSKVWPRLDEIDPCFSNFSPAFAFIDDGEVVPGVGPSICETWCYGPGGFVVNHTGGRLGPDFHIKNEIWSPPIEIPAGDHLGAELVFDVFRHNPFSTQASGHFYIWGLRSTADPTGADGWTEWRDRGFVYEGGPRWQRHSEIIGFLMLPDAAFVQISLGVWELGWVWGIQGDDGTPAPYFDNVAFKVWPGGGPTMTARTVNLANDGFPESGDLDLVNLGANSVRFDSAINVSQDVNVAVPGDSVLIDVRPSRDGATLDSPPVMRYRLRPNPLFDPHRTSGWSLSGEVEGLDPYGNGIIWHFDLPDTGFFYPGDELHYYFTASETFDGGSHTTILPADTTGYSSFGNGDAPVTPYYHSQFTARALPSLTAADLDSLPPILLWDDADDPSEQRYWRQSLANLGLYPGEHYDIYTTRAAGSEQANGLGGRAELDQVAPYSTILYASAHVTPTLSGQTYIWGEPNPAPDVIFMDAWLQLGDRKLLLSGDRIVSDLEGNDTSTLAFLLGWIQAETTAGTLHDALDGQISPTVEVVAANPVFTNVELWRAFTCPRSTGFQTLIDAVSTTGTGQALATFRDRDGDPAAYPYAAAVLSEIPAHTASIVLLPYGMRRLETPVGHPDGPLAVRTMVLSDVLGYFGHTVFGAPTSVPTTQVLSVAARPNPFNPRVTIEYALPRAGDLSVRIVDVRGRRVRNLHSGRAAAGAGTLAWEGVDDTGQAVAAGVYFCEVRTQDHTKVLKLALIK